VIIDAASPANRWDYYGRDADSTRYAPIDQINTGNVNQLQVAWTYRTGAATTAADEDQNTPIQVGNSVFLCTPQNKVIALNAETGAERWTFDPKPATPRPGTVVAVSRGMTPLRTCAAPTASAAAASSPPPRTVGCMPWMPGPASGARTSACRARLT
jgi:quinate dehydrogenase (quinone)